MARAATRTGRRRVGAPGRRAAASVVGMDAEEPLGSSRGEWPAARGVGRRGAMSGCRCDGRCSGTSEHRQAGADPAVSARARTVSRPRRGRRGRRPQRGSGCACAGSSCGSRLLSFAVVAGRETTLAGTANGLQGNSQNLAKSPHWRLEFVLECEPERVRERAPNTAKAPARMGEGLRETVVRQITGDGLASEPAVLDADGIGSSSATHSSSSARNVCQTA